MLILIHEVRINTASVKYIQERQILQQYLKAKKYILAGNFDNIRLKLRELKSDGIWYFRINQQYRAHARYEDSILGIFRIDDHSR